MRLPLFERQEALIAMKIKGSRHGMSKYAQTANRPEAATLQQQQGSEKFPNSGPNYYSKIISDTH